MLPDFFAAIFCFILGVLFTIGFLIYTILRSVWTKTKALAVYFFKETDVEENANRIEDENKEEECNNNEEELDQKNASSNFVKNTMWKTKISHI